MAAVARLCNYVFTCYAIITDGTIRRTLIIITTCFGCVWLRLVPTQIWFHRDGFSSEEYPLASGQRLQSFQKAEWEESEFMQAVKIASMSYTAENICFLFFVETGWSFVKKWKNIRGAIAGLASPCGLKRRSGGIFLVIPQHFWKPSRGLSGAKSSTTYGREDKITDFLCERRLALGKIDFFTPVLFCWDSQ